MTNKKAETLIEEIHELIQKREEIEKQIDEKLKQITTLPDNKNKIWTKTDEKEAYKLRKEGLTCEEIALKLGRTESSIKNKVSRIKLEKARGYSY